MISTRGGRPQPKNKAKSQSVKNKAKSRSVNEERSKRGGDRNVNFVRKEDGIQEWKAIESEREYRSGKRPRVSFVEYDEKEEKEQE